MRYIDIQYKESTCIVHAQPVLISKRTLSQALELLIRCVSFRGHCHKLNAVEVHGHGAGV